MSPTNSSSYNAALRKHLAEYKRNVLGVSRNGSWDEREYAHILPPDRKERNIIEPYRDEFWEYWEQQRRKQQRRKHLHKDFAHLNSSQAMCFNLFFPFFAENGRLASLLPAAIGLFDGGSEAWEFEYVAPDGSNIDLVLTTPHRRVFMEVKLTESGFGAGEENERRLRKLDGIYSERMKRFTPEFCEQRRFFKNYQILRTIWQVRSGSEDLAVFVFPKANLSLQHGEMVIRNCTLPHLRDRVQIVDLEDLIASIDTPELTPRARSHFRQLREKYLI